MGATTKRELVKRIAEKTNQTQVAVGKTVQLFLDECISELVKDQKLEFRDFGIFEVKQRKARKARNPRTGEEVFVDAKSVVKFRPGRLMREQIR